MLAWVTNMSISPDLYIEFSAEYQTDPLFMVYEAINSEHQISHGMANPLLEGGLQRIPKGLRDKFQLSPDKLL